jgi:dTDP-4-amino-4,6-dideoxygalactose transaminase
MRVKSFLPFAPPAIGEEEIEEVVDSLHSDWITTGPKVQQFQQAFAEYLGSPGALALNSCTAGLHTALATLGIGHGDEVITTPMTFAASVNVIEHVGATPVLADVEPDTLNIDPARVEPAITPRTRALLIVHYSGHPANLAALRDLAYRHGLAMVEDAAHALPARYRGELIGASSTPTAFSFYATKNMTTAEGGMLTGDPEFIERARMISLHGMNRDAWKRYGQGGNWFYEVVFPGFKYNMTDIQAAMGIHQLQKLEQFQRRRQQIVQAYTAAFAGEDTLETPTVRPDVEHAWHLYVLRLRHAALTISREQFIEELGQRNIGTSVHFIPIHLHPYYRDKYGYRPGDFPVAYEHYQRMLSLPLHPRMSEEDVADVIDAVLDVTRHYHR